MRVWIGLRLSVGVAGMMAAAAVALITASTVGATGVTGAVFTTTNPAQDNLSSGSPTLCNNGNPGTSGPNYVPAINCNIFTAKTYVWLTGGPGPSGLKNGTYFFAVLVPGGQPDPNDGGAKNLSDMAAAPWPASSLNADGSAIPSGDAYTNRTFTSTGGTIGYSGTHDFFNNEIRLMPYDDTSNPGGVYIMAVCSLADGYPVDPSKCKYDAFKVLSSTVTIPPAVDLTVTKDAAGSYKNTFAWTISKDVDKTKITQSDTSATFNYTVTVTHDGGTISDVNVAGTIQVLNPNTDIDGNVLPVTISGVTDQLSDGTTCSVTGGASTLIDFETDFGYTCSLSGLPQTALDNTATVSWDTQTLSGGEVLTGNSADFTFANISFAETKVDDCVTVTDPLGGGTLGSVCVGGDNPKSFTYSNTVTGTPGTCVTQNNTATFTTNSAGTTGSASQSVQLCVGKDLGVSKTATPTFTRSYNWKIEKAVDKTLLDAGGTAHYTVTVTELGFTDSAWKVNGTITVTNPNDFESVTFDLADTIDNGGVCSITGGGTAQTLLASASQNYSYSCSFASAPTSSTGTNTATATWDKAVYFTPDGTSSGTAAYTFNDGSAGNPTRINQTVHVTDSFAGPLGTVTATDVTPYTVTYFTYSRTFTPPASGCQTVNNIATITETSQSAGASVRVCNTGALTMGFWQNKNGQGLISAANQSSLSTFLKQFHPFSDAPSTGLATYAYSIIKAATCGGVNCNAMLRAQMLATALDVYFSDVSLGGNKIGATVPIGTVVIDLTHICAMIDGSGGSTCSGSYENVSAAFGGATSMSVMGMLLYQNTSDPAADAGAAWYGQNKATQVLAKDAFDAINNQVAVSP
jgi:hypothetical protein